MQTTLLMFLLLGCMLFAQMVSAQPKSTKMVSCRRFVQKNPIIGEQEIKVIPNAVRVELKLGGWVQFARGPEWKTVLINESAKMYCKNAKDTWWDRMIGFGSNVTIKETSKSVYPKSEKVLWMDTTKVKVINVPPAPNADCYYYKDSTIPDIVCKRLAIQSAAPHLGGLLVRMKVLDKEGPGAVKLDTLKADRLVVPASEFEIPSGFKEVFTPQEIMLGTGADGLKDFLP